MTLLWRKVLECSSSHCSLRHPCDLTHMEEGSGVFFLTLLTHFVIPVSSLTPMEEGSGMFFLTAHFVIPVSSLTPMEEVSGVFFLTAHFVIPVSSLLWRKFLECSSSLLTSSSLCPHSLRHPCDLTPMTCLLTHLIVIPDFSLESSHPSHL